MKNPKLIVALVLLALVVAVALQNSETVETRVLTWSFEAPRALLVTGTLAVGFLAGFLMGARFARRRRK